MVRLFTLGLLVVASLVAYPWAAAVLAGTVLVVVLVRAGRRGWWARWQPPATASPVVSAERREALRLAYEDLRRIDPSVEMPAELRTRKNPRP